MARCLSRGQPSAPTAHQGHLAFKEHSTQLQSQGSPGRRARHWHLEFSLLITVNATQNPLKKFKHQLLQTDLFKNVLLGHFAFAELKQDVRTKFLSIKHTENINQTSQIPHFLSFLRKQQQKQLPRPIQCPQFLQLVLSLPVAYSILMYVY